MELAVMKNWEVLDRRMGILRLRVDWKYPALLSTYESILESHQGTYAAKPGCTLIQTVNDRNKSMGLD